VRHTITHHRVRVHVHVGHATDRVQPPFAWFTAEEIESLPRTGMTKKIAARGWIGPDAPRRQ
jgi:hypothetical protein